MNSQQIFLTNDEQSYDSFQNILKEYIGGDCWALEVDSNFIFNSYLDKERSIRENILDHMIRENMIENPHSNLLVYLHRRGMDAEIRIHMYMDQSLTIIIHYNAELSLYEIVL